MYNVKEIKYSTLDEPENMLYVAKPPPPPPFAFTFESAFAC